MPLLNYTTTVAASKTVGQVQELLVKAGATSIHTEYVEGRAAALSFVVETEYGIRGFTLPIDVDAVTKVLRNDRRVTPKYRTPEQAERVAWRILKDWVEAQLAIIETRMVSLDQVMLPYMQDASGKTVFDLYRTRQLALEAG